MYSCLWKDAGLSYHLLMVRADGAAPSVITTRMIAAVMTNTPEERSRPITILRRIGTLSFHKRGSGIIRICKCEICVFES